MAFVLESIQTAPVFVRGKTEWCLYKCTGVLKRMRLHYYRYKGWYLEMHNRPTMHPLHLPYFIKLCQIHCTQGRFEDVRTANWLIILMLHMTKWMWFHFWGNNSSYSLHISFSFKCIPKCNHVGFYSTPYPTRDCNQIDSTHIYYW